MRVNAELYVKDLPGQLVGSLEPISMVDGNIMGVVHNREQIVNHRICINVTFEVDDPMQLNKLEQIWKSKDVVISKMGSVYQTHTMEYMLIGEFNAQFIEGIIEEASETIALEAVDVRYSSKTNGFSKRTGMIAIKTRSAEDLDKMDVFLKGICREKNITYVRGV